MLIAGLLSCVAIVFAVVVVAMLKGAALWDDLFNGIEIEKEV